MQFSKFVRKEVSGQILFSTPFPLDGIKDIKYYKDNSSGSFSKKEFRWSFNGDYWSSWTPLNQNNLSSFKIGNNRYLFLEIKYIPESGGAVSIFDLYYDGTVDNNAVYDQCKISDTSDSSSNYKRPTPSPDYVDDKCPTIIPPSDAETLNGKSGDYYLWRPNHKGQQSMSTITNLELTLNNIIALVNNSTITGASNVEGEGIGVYYNRIEKTLLFKRLVSGGKISLTENEGGIISINFDDASINDLYKHLGDLSPVNIGGGQGEIFKQRVGDEFQLRTIVPGNSGVSVTTIGDQIRIGIDASISGELWTDLDPISADVGGLSNGDTLNGLTSIEVLEKMLYEYKPPATNLFMNPSSGYYEKYDPFVTDVCIFGNFSNTNFTKVDITDVSIYSSVIGGFGHISYLDVSQGEFSFSDNASFSFWNDVIYTIKIYNKVDLNIMPTADSSIELKFTLPYIWGIVDNTINSGNLTPAILEGFHSAGQKIIAPKRPNEIEFIRPVGITKAKFIYAYDQSYGELLSIFDIKNDFNITSSFETGTLNLTLGAGSNIPYRFYIKSHWIDVDKFKILFNI